MYGCVGYNVAELAQCKGGVGVQGFTVVNDVAIYTDCKMHFVSFFTAVDVNVSVYVDCEV